MTPLTIQQICSIVGGRRTGVDDSSQVTGCVIDSRMIRPGDLFFALRGEHCHGVRYAADAVARGAVAVVTDSRHASACQAPTIDDSEAQIRYSPPKNTRARRGKSQIE